MLQRALKRLPYLGGIIRMWIIWYSVVLSINICEFGLQKELLSGNTTFDDGITHCSFIVMFTLISGINRSKASLESSKNKIFSSICFPCSTVDNGWNIHVLSKLRSVAMLWVLIIKIISYFFLFIKK